MNRRQFLKRGALLGGALAATTASPVLAAHATEPHEPIIGIGLDVYKYPNNNTKVTRRVLIPEPDTQPPSGVTTTSVAVEVRDRIGPGGVTVSTVPGVTWVSYGAEVTFDPTTGLPIIFGNIRTEPFVAIGRDARNNQRPSEHWDSRMTVERVTNLTRDRRNKLWDTLVRHANLGPHNSDGSNLSFKGGFHEAEQDNDYPQGERVVAGEIIAISWQLEGWESKRRFFVESKFIWGG